MWSRFIWLVAITTVLVASADAQDLVSCRQTDEILAELRDLRMLVDNLVNGRTLTQRPPSGAQAQIAAATIKVDVGNSPLLGSKEAAVTIVEFTDFQCPYCNQFFLQTFPELKKNYIDSGKVRFFNMDFPLNIHGNALRAAQAGRCAGDQNLFWPMHDRMQSNPQQLELKNLLDYAHDIGLDVTLFRGCLDTEKYKVVILQEGSEAVSKAVRGTPTFVIGKSTATGVEGTIVVGAQPYELFDKMLKNLVQ